MSVAHSKEQKVPLMQHLEINALNIRKTAKYSVCLQGSYLVGDNLQDGFKEFAQEGNIPGLSS